MIKIFITVDSSKVIFKDTGTGISGRDLPYIFDRFYSKTRHGTGIGLAFCQMAVELCNGEIKCNSKEGEYTEFVITMPKLKEERKI